MRTPRGWVYFVGMALAGWASAATRYVDIGATGANDGSTWTDAYTNLQTALGASGSGDALWVAQGVYTPGSARSSTFQLITGVSIYGGFTNGMDSLEARDWTAFPTILSGEIGDSGTVTDNVTRVVTAAGQAVLDGLTIADGYNTTGGGAGLYAANTQNVQVRNSLFVNNAAKHGGAVYVYNGAEVFLTNTTFRGNQAQATSSGGAIYLLSATSTVVVDRCVFVENTSTGSGGAAFISGGMGVFRDSVFTANHNAVGDGGAVAGSAAKLTVESCVLSGNRSEGRGGGIYATGGTLSASRNFVLGQLSRTGGGGIYVINATSASIVNGLIAGNATTGTSAQAGGLYIQGVSTSSVVANCTITGNRATGHGGGVANSSSAQAFFNTILWSNSTSASGGEYYYASVTPKPTLSFCVIEGGINGSKFFGQPVTDGGGNLSGDPLFPAPLTGVWTADAGYDATSGRTTLYDAGAAWAVDSLKGLGVNPGGGQYRQFYVVSNTATSLVVYGDCAPLGTNGAAYALHDYRPLAGSPCQDWGTASGAPAVDIVGTPRPQGDLPDVGAYEITTAPVVHQGPISRFK